MAPIEQLPIPPTEQRIVLLVKMLIRGTNQNLLKWQETADEETFRLASPAANVRITRLEEYDQEVMKDTLTRRLSIFNDRSRLIEVWEPASPVEEQEFDSLFVNARRSAQNTDAVLDKLMMELRASGVS